MKVASTTSPSRTFRPSLRTVSWPSAPTCTIERVSSDGEDHGLLVAAEVVVAHRRDGGPGLAAPRAHRVGVGLRVVLDRGGRAAVGVALAQHRVDRGALDLVVAGAGLALLVGLRVLRVVGQVVALRLQLGDGRLELRDRGGDVGELDDVGLGPGRQLAELGQRVVEALLVGEAVGELGDHAAGQRDVTGLDVHTGGLRVGGDDRQERVRREQRRLVGVGVDDLGHGYDSSCRSRSDPGITLDVKIPDAGDGWRLAYPRTPPVTPLGFAWPTRGTAT